MTTQRLCSMTILSLLLIAIFPAAFASPNRTFFHEGGLSVSQVKNPGWVPYNLSTTEVYAAPFLKYKTPMPAALQDHLYSSITPRVAGQVVTATNGEYIFPVDIGTPKQRVHLIFDSGSADFWVWSWEMPAAMLSYHSGYGSYYNATKSSTSAISSGETFSANYASGSTSGNVYTDWVYVAGGDGSTIGIEDNPVECATTADVHLQSTPAVDGIMGLNRAVNDGESPSPQQTWLNYVLGNFATQVFTTALVSGGVGTMDFGVINSTKYTGSISYASVVDVPGQPVPSLWSFYSSGFAVGSSTFNSTSIPVITDTGSTLSLLPASITTKYYAQVTGSYKQSDGTWAFPCTATLPNFTFGVGTGRIVVIGHLLIFSTLSDGVNCMGAIQATTETGYAMFATPFFNSLFVVHDLGNTKIGFAARASLTS